MFQAFKERGRAATGKYADLASAYTEYANLPRRELTESELSTREAVRAATERKQSASDAVRALPITASVQRRQNAEAAHQETLIEWRALALEMRAAAHRGGIVRLQRVKARWNDVATMIAVLLADIAATREDLVPHVRRIAATLADGADLSETPDGTASEPRELVAACITASTLIKKFQLWQAEYVKPSGELRAFNFGVGSPLPKMFRELAELLQ